MAHVSNLCAGCERQLLTSLEARFQGHAVIPALRLRSGQAPAGIQEFAQILEEATPFLAAVALLLLSFIFRPAQSLL